MPKLERPLLIDPENTIPRAIEVVFGSSPSRRYALVHSSFTPDASYYNTWASPPRLACIYKEAPWSAAGRQHKSRDRNGRHIFMEALSCYQSLSAGTCLLLPKDKTVILSVQERHWRL